MKGIGKMRGELSTMFFSCGPIKRVFRTLCGFLLMVVVCNCVWATPCVPPSSSELYRAKKYIAARLELDASKITVTAGTPSALLSCFTQLIVHDAVSKEEFVLYMSSNGRALTSELYDASSDPVAEKRERIEKLKGLLNAGIPTKGPGDSSIEIVAFVDFECPFCRQMDTALSHLLTAGQPKVKIAYREYPIPSHPWAMQAAELTACVREQDPGSFWRLSENIFQNQEGLTVENFEQKSIGWLEAARGLDNVKVDRCVKSGEGRALVEKDVALGQQLGVNATPTLFVNGTQFDGTGSDETGLKALIAKVN